MALADFTKQLDDLAAQAVQAFASAATAEAVEASRVEFLGAKQGRLKAAQKGMGAIDKSDRPAAGKRFNEVKEQVESAFKAASERLAASPVVAKKKEGPQFDPTVPGTPLRIGHLHPITQTMEELKDIMGRLGFSVADGPEVEARWHNFEAATNIPREHPARDPLDNFYLATADTAAGSRNGGCCAAGRARSRSG